MGDMQADLFGMRVDNPIFQEAINYALEDIGE
jgi:hypothetical protein